MKLFNRSFLLIGIIYFLILLGIALWVRDIAVQPIEYEITPLDLIKTTHMQDPATFASAAIDIAENGWISSANEWILNLWPPGFILLEASIIKVLGPDAPVILVLQIMSAGLFSCVMLQLYDFLNVNMSKKVAFVLPLIIFAFPVSRVFLLEPTGIVLGESFAIGFFLLGILFALRSVKLSLLRYAAYAGLCLALSAYFRSQFEVILLVLAGWGVLLIIAINVTQLRKTIDRRSVLKPIIISLIVAHAATMPWRAYHWVYQGKPFWVASSEVMLTNSVMTSDFLNGAHGGFVVEGAGNLVCRINSASCGNTADAKRLFIETFIKHPVEWYSLKADVIGKYWFASLENWTNVSVKPTPLDMAVNALLLIALIALIVMLFTRKVRLHNSWILLIWFTITLLSAYTLIFTVAHFETRYFYFPKIVSIFMLIIICSLYNRPLNEEKSALVIN